MSQTARLIFLMSLHNKVDKIECFTQQQDILLADKFFDYNVMCLICNNLHDFCDLEF